MQHDKRSIKNNQPYLNLGDKTVYSLCSIDFHLSTANYFCRVDCCNIVRVWYFGGKIQREVTRPLAKLSHTFLQHNISNFRLFLIISKETKFCHYRLPYFICKSLYQCFYSFNHLLVKVHALIDTVLFQFVVHQYYRQSYCSRFSAKLRVTEI